MKGYCQCGGVVDEVEYSQFKSCAECYGKSQNPIIKHTHLKITKGNIDYHYDCSSSVWNYYLNRYYPKADLIMVVEHLNNGLKIDLP